MSNTQKLVVTRQTTIELVSDGPAEPLVKLDVLGQQAIEGTARETVAEIEAAREAEGDSEPDTNEFKSVDDVDKFASDTAESSVTEALADLNASDPWNDFVGAMDRKPEDMLR